MAFAVQEIFYSLQGEGHQVGRPAVFCRFRGCNLWNGREEDRASALCRFCDTNFQDSTATGGNFSDTQALVKAICALFPKFAPKYTPSAWQSYRPYVILTGGEPALQITEELIQALKQRGLELGIETNGTLPLPQGLDWICVSPKAGTKLVQRSGSEVKLVWPQDGLNLAELEALDFKYFYLQARDSQDASIRKAHVRECLEFCLARPLWRLSLQSHKYLGIP